MSDASVSRRDPEPVPQILESQGRPLFTFSSETASLIKFLTVSTALPVGIQSCDKTERTSHGGAPCSGDFSPNSPDCDVCKTIVFNQDLTPAVDRQKQVMYSNIAASGVSAVQDRMETDDSKCMYRMYKQSQQTQTDGAQCGCSNTQAHKLCKTCVNYRSLRPGSSREVEMKDPEFCSGDHVDLDRHKVIKSKKSHHVIKSVPKHQSQAQACVPDNLHLHSRLKNLIFVTGEFAVALHQLGFKNIPPSRESALARGAIQYDLGNMDAYNMVVNYSNNDIHIVQRQQEPDKPDHLIDLYGHVTGLCLTPDQR